MKIIGKLKEAFLSKQGQAHNSEAKDRGDSKEVEYEGVKQYRVRVSEDRPIEGEMSEEWSLLDGQSSDVKFHLHREDGPAVTIRDKKTGAILEVEYRIANQLHREDKPARIQYDLETGNVIREEYWRKSKLHNINGPAFIDRDARTGEIKSKSYFIDGNEVSSRGLDHQQI